MASGQAGLRQKIKSALLGSTVLGSRLTDTGYFNPDFLKKMLEQHESGVRDHSTPLWSILMFDSFLGLKHSNSVIPEAASAEV